MESEIKMYGKDQKCSRKPSGLFFLLLLTSFFSLLLPVQIMRVYMRSSVGILTAFSSQMPLWLGLLLVFFFQVLSSSPSNSKSCKYKRLPENNVKPPGLSPAHPWEGVVVLGALLLQAEQQGGKSRHGGDVHAI